ncbi:phosphoribosylformylglycinamidine synthase subunit PurL [Helicobacter sp. MIT 01-3238]|uniref:phosphoribosylformylglycinamidine synthase subunit PurL n=1 Tax=Helicobacter sp. MIT 01-3238 TaxID=398627 RepID=UPI000E1F4C59|nr:phosphoribosylformylglycinamidine synthase subunit PurL [Helicobacter sp. MIT 01-3238]
MPHDTLTKISDLHKKFCIADMDCALSSHKLSKDDYSEILRILGREPNLVELGIFSAMWSEHCSYKSSKIYLNGFPTSAEYVIQGPGENAGVIDIGGGMAAVFKVESHNHPSFIEPTAGAATGVGGIMRDIFTMGARPVASLDSIRFGEVYREDAIGKKHKYLLSGVVEGIGGYGNCMGVPTIGGESTFEPCYNGNILVNAFCLGLAKKEEIFYAKAEGVGNPVIYVGSKTGRDGLGGAVMSSDSFSEDSTSLRPTVQVGDPFTEKLLLEACLELFKRDLIVGIQDMGAAGLTSSSFEMAGRSGSGMRLELEKVPMRESQMNAYELMLSESQERMLICAKKGKEGEIKEIFEKWELDCAIIGEVTDSGIMELLWEGECVGKIPIAPLSEASPVLKRKVDKPSYLDEINKLDSSFIKNLNDKSNNDLFRELLGHIDICDKKWIYSQYDSTVQTNTIVPSGKLDGSVVRVKENGNALAMSIYCAPQICYLNPREGGKIAVATAGRKLATRGAKPLAISDCLNFGNPQNPEVMWQFSEVCEGIKQACKELKTPVVSGNVSLYNQTDEIDIYPTPTIVSVGISSACASNRSGADYIIDSALKENGNVILLLGNICDISGFSGSVAQKIIGGGLCGEVRIDLDRERALWEFLHKGIASGQILSAKAVGKGGIAIALAKMAILGGKGVDARGFGKVLESMESKNSSKNFGGDSSEDFSNDFGVESGKWLFAQTQSCALVECAPSQVVALQKSADLLNIPLCEVGKVCGEVVYEEMTFGERDCVGVACEEVPYVEASKSNLRICIADIDIDLSKASKIYFESFEKYIH